MLFVKPPRGERKGWDSPRRTEADFRRQLAIGREGDIGCQAVEAARQSQGVGGTHFFFYVVSRKRADDRTVIEQVPSAAASRRRERRAFRARRFLLFFFGATAFSSHRGVQSLLPSYIKLLMVGTQHQVPEAEPWINWDWRMCAWPQEH